MIPHILDGSGNARLAPDLDITVKLPGRAKAHYVTDSGGARVFGVAQRGKEGKPEVLFIGDSQILGWGLEFGDTVAGKVAHSLTGDAGNASILAAAATDPETLSPWVRDYVRAFHQTRRATFISLNLGNDLDELYLSRSTVSYSPLRGLTQWLSTRSFLFLDIMLAKIYLFGEPSTIPPGTNPSLFSLSEDEQALLADEVVRKLGNTVREVQPSEFTAVIVLPNDYQIDPAQFQKYRAAFPNEASFRMWERNIPEAIGRMNKLQQMIVSRLREAGIPVVDALSLLKPHPADKLFDSHSHHLTAYGHGVLSAGMLAQLESAK